MKVAIVYDRVNKFGGAERVLLALHETFPDAPLYTSVYSKENANWAKIFPEIKTTFLQYIPFAKNHHEIFAPFMLFAFSLFNFDNYDLVISVTSEFAKNINTKTKHICYCLTPTRYLWSHHEEYFQNKILRFLYKPLIQYLKNADIKASKKPDEMIAISTEVQKRIKKYYKRESEIIFPPVNVLKFSSPKKFENLRTSWPDLSNFSSVRKTGYYLLVSRLVKYKKVDLAIRAFNELNLPLVIVGTGREENKLKKLANKNILFAGFVPENDLSKYYSNAKALVFPQDEDFGIVAVEAQSYGLPVIAYKSGGAMDIVNKNTGVFFEEQNIESLINAIKKFQKMKFNSKLIMKNADRFSKDKFKKEFLALVREL
jgi:glycosyltransferase involved in cell wall biosynthesis